MAMAYSKRDGALAKRTFMIPEQSAQIYLVPYKNWQARRLRASMTA